MPRRPVTAALVASVVLAGAATACGSSGGGPTGPTAAAPAPVGKVDIDPSSGPVGTVFTLKVDRLLEGAVVAFEIAFPGEGKAYPGAALTVPADGTATTTYRATTANKPGDYAVRLTGAPGTLAEGRFRVTDGPPLVSTIVPVDTGPPTSLSAAGRTGTTTRSGRSSTTAAAGGLGATTTTSAKPAATTTTRRPAATFATTTTRPGTTTTRRV